VVSDGKGSTPKLKARLMATGQEGTFGESGERITMSVEDTPQDSRELLAQVDFSPNSNAGMESMLGFRQDLGFAGAVQSLAAVSIHPELEGAGKSGVQQAVLESKETLHLGDSVDAQVGATESLMRTSGGVMTQSLPFVNAGLHTSDATTIHYRFATQLQDSGTDLGTSEGALPRVASRGGKIAVEHGIHHEIGWERHVGTSGMAVRVNSDKIYSPALEASAHWGPGSGPANFGVLFDPLSGLHE
jgi:hypothetical protein